MADATAGIVNNPQDVLKDYLEEFLREEVGILNVQELGDDDERRGLKAFGYGTPLKIEYSAGMNGPRNAVLHTMKAGPFGHEHMADRAQVLLWQSKAFNQLPRHVRALDIGGFRADKSLVSLSDVEEFCLLTEFAPGDSYANDCERLSKSAVPAPVDIERADALCDYLVSIHARKTPDTGLYLRRIRELVGHGECIMGIIDAYPEHPLFPAELLERIEEACVRWRWKLKPRTHRVCQVHGDFHPWNILFAEGASFTALDRSRGEYGEAADDVVSLTLNYLFFSLQARGRLEGALEVLFHRFWNRYLERSGDREMLDVAAPFVVFRALVMASPVWYPDLPDTVRESLFSLILRVLEEERLDLRRINEYCGN